MYHIPFIVQCIYGWSNEGKDGDGKEGSEPNGFLYADDLVLCDESEEDQNVNVGRLLRFLEGED